MSLFNTTTLPLPSLLASPLNLLLNPQQWYPSPTRTILPQPWFLPVTLCSCIFSSLLRRKARLWIATPALLILISQTRVYSTGNIMKDYGRAALVFGWVLKWIDLEMLVKEGDIWKVKGKNGDEKSRKLEYKQKVGIRVEEKDKGLWPKFKDTIEVWTFNYRGIGWNWEVGGIPDRPQQSKNYFLLRTALRILGSYLALDLCRFLCFPIHYIHLSPRPSFFAQPIAIQVLLTWLHQLEAFAVMNAPYQLVAFFCVLTNLHTPDDWPPLFGSLSDSYLVSRAWGRTWHQLLRRPLALLTPHAQHWLGAKSRGAKRSVSLFCSFFMSGLMHWSGALNLPWTPSAHGMFTYFIMQAPVIRLEDYVVDFGKDRGIKGSRVLKIVGYFWTFAWISFSMRYAAAYQFESGPLSKFQPLWFSLMNLVTAKIGLGSR